MCALEGGGFRGIAARVGQTACKPGSVPLPCEHGCAAAIPLDRPLRDGSRDQPGRLGPATALPACQDRRAHRPYSVLLQAGLAMPSRSPGPRWALTPPFHPCPPLYSRARGGLLSVALSLGSLPAGVTRRLVAVEPGLSSPSQKGEGDRPAVWPALGMGWNDTGVNRRGLGMPLSVAAASARP